MCDSDGDTIIYNYKTKKEGDVPFFEDVKEKKRITPKQGRVVIFAGGTGNPYMTTDTAAALRALEIGSEALIMAKNGIDGVYDSDPSTNPNAKKFSQLTHHEAISKRLKALDSTALSLCMDNSLPIEVFNIFSEGNLKSVISGNKIRTRIIVK